MSLEGGEGQSLEMKHLILTFFYLVSLPVFAQGTRPEGRLIIEANAKHSETSGEMNLVYRFAPTAIGQETQATVLIYNPTDVPLTSMVGTILNAHFRFVGNAYPGVGGTCAKTLEPRSTCTVKLRFSPQSEGLKRGLVRINYWEGGQPKTSYRQLIGESSSEVFDNL